MRYFQEFFGIACAIHRKIKYPVCTLVVPSYFVARGGEESEENFISGIIRFQALDNGASLFKFTK